MSSVCGLDNKFQVTPSHGKYTNSVSCILLLFGTIYTSLHHEIFKNKQMNKIYIPYLELRVLSAGGKTDRRLKSVRIRE